MTNAERQARLRERRAAAGLRPVTVWVPDHAIGSVQQAAEALCEGMCNGQRLEVARLVDRSTGKLRGIKV